ncbi:MAG: hypothetical protein RR869_07890 [Lachnospiraceae bacterium]
MKRVMGFALFCLAVGMLIMLLLSHKVLGLFIIAACLLIGYNLFCC